MPCFATSNQRAWNQHEDMQRNPVAVSSSASTLFLSLVWRRGFLLKHSTANSSQSNYTEMADSELSPLSTTSSLSPSPSIEIVSNPSYIKAQNRGPITSLFIPPSSCTATVTAQQGSSSGYFIGHSYDAYFDPSCFPLGTMASQDLATNGDLWKEWYCEFIADVSSTPFMFQLTDSPAICPYGWTIATTFQSSIPGGYTWFLSIGAETTAGLCCPS